MTTTGKWAVAVAVAMVVMLIVLYFTTSTNVVFSDHGSMDGFFDDSCLQGPVGQCRTP